MYIRRIKMNLLKLKLKSEKVLKLNIGQLVVDIFYFSVSISFSISISINASDGWLCMMILKIVYTRIYRLKRKDLQDKANSDVVLVIQWLWCVCVMNGVNRTYNLRTRLTSNNIVWIVWWFNEDGQINC